MTYLGIYASFGRFAIAEDSSLKRIKKVKINKTVFGCIMGFDITSKTRYNIKKISTERSMAEKCETGYKQLSKEEFYEPARNTAS